MEAAQPAAAAPAPPRLLASLYVGDLPTDLPNPEDALFNHFNKAGMVISIKVCRDINTQRSLGYAYVNFQSPADAERALETLNYTEIVPRRQIRIMWSSRDPTVRRSGAGNIFVKNLSPDVTSRVLRDTFSNFGTVVSVKIATDETGRSRGYGFVQFEKDEAARLALKFNGDKILGEAVSVGPFVKKSEREAEAERVFTSVYLKNIKPDATDDDVRAALGGAAVVKSLFVSGHPQHPTKFALATLETHEDALAAIERLNNSETSPIVAPSTKLYAGRAVKKADRQKQQGRDGSGAALYQSQGRNLYIKHLDDGTTTERLEELFAPFGKITSVALSRDASGTFRGFAFVCFDAKESATAAIRELNGKVVLGRRPLYVAHAQQRDMRHKVLEDQRRAAVVQQQRMSLQMTQHLFMNPHHHHHHHMAPWGAGPAAPPMGMPPGVGPRMGGPLPPPGGMAGYPPMPFMPPFVMPGPQQPPMMMPPPGRNMRPPMRGGMPPMGAPMQGPPMGGMPPRGMPPHAGMPGAGSPQRGMPGAAPRYAQQPPQHAAQQRPAGPAGGSGLSANTLAKMSPEEQKNTLGERLYAKINEITPAQAAKITGMLLEMEIAEILNVLEDPRTLMAKVNEAIHVLQQHEAATH